MGLWKYGIYKAEGPTPTPKGDCYVCGGVTYVRWGRTACPNTEGTELVYNGTAAASASTNRGGGANYQCLPDDPENLAYNPGSVVYTTYMA